MGTNDHSLSSQETIDKLYSSGSAFIRWLLSRLLKRTSDLLMQINAYSKKGLDVGCGEGNFINYLAQQKVIGPLVAVDLNFNKLRAAQQHYSDYTFLNTDVTALNFKNEAFDYVVASEIFEHLPNPSKAMHEIQRVAKNDAYLIISVPHEPFFRWGNFMRGKYWQRGGRTPAHVNFWTRSDFKRFIGDFVEIEKEYCFPVFPWLLYLGKFKRRPVTRM